MNDDQGHVYPLRCRRSYKTSVYSGVAAVYCTTDGLFKDYFVNLGTNDKSRADKLIPYKLFDNGVEDADGYIEQFKSAVMSFCESNDSLTDDLSVAFLMNTDKAVVKTEKEPIDFITSVRAVVSLYEDERIRKKAFIMNVQAHYPQFSEEDALALYEGETVLAEVIAKYKNIKNDEPEISEVEDAEDKTDVPADSESEAEDDPCDKDESEPSDTEDVIPDASENEDPNDEPITETPDEGDEPAAEADPDGDEAEKTDDVTPVESEESPHETIEEEESSENDEADEPADEEDEKDRVLFNIFKRKKRNKEERR